MLPRKNSPPSLLPPAGTPRGGDAVSAVPRFPAGDDAGSLSEYFGWQTNSQCLLKKEPQESSKESGLAEKGMNMVPTEGVEPTRL